MKIFVHNKDLGFWTQEPITVTRSEVIEDEDRSELVWCNHAAAEYVEEEKDIVNIDAPDVTYTVKFYECGKCGAYRFEGEDSWENEPVEGVHYE